MTVAFGQIVMSENIPKCGYCRMHFANRLEAGRQLAEQLAIRGGLSGAVVLGLPRGGVPVAAPVARRLHAPMDVFVVRKLGVPGYSELAMGAIASGGVRVLNTDVIHSLGIPEVMIDTVAESEERELSRREHAYRDHRPVPDVRGKTVILVDDGIATGSTMGAAIAALRRARAARVVVAAPVIARDTRDELLHVADDVVCVIAPEYFRGVGEWYADFTQTTDAEVRDILARHTSAEAS